MFDSLGTRHYLDVGIISEKETGSKNHSGPEFLVILFFEDFESFSKANRRKRILFSFIGGLHIRL